MDRVIAGIRKLFKTGFFHIFGSSVINKIIGFLSSIVLVRILSKSEYGIFTYAWNIYGFVLLLQGMGVGSGVLQIASEHSSDTSFVSRVCNFGARFGVAFDVLLCVILLTIGLLVPLKIQGSNEILILLCLLPMAQLLFQLTLDFLRAQKRNQEYARLTMVNTILLFVVSAGCAYLFREKGLVAGYYVAYLSTFLAGLLFFKIHLFSHEEQLDEENRKALLKIAFISMFNNGLSQLMYLLDVFVLGLVDPQETVLASYKVATMIPSALIFIPQALVTYIYPYFAEHKDDGKWCLKKYKQVLLGIGSLNLCISIILFLGAPLIVQIFFGKQYIDAVPVFRILAINYFFSGTFRTIAGNILVTQRKLKFNLFVGIVSSVVNIVADYLFIQWWGAIGAAFATVMVVAVSSIMFVSYLIYTLKKKMVLD